MFRKSRRNSCLPGTRASSPILSAHGEADHRTFLTLDFVGGEESFTAGCLGSDATAFDGLEDVGQFRPSRAVQQGGRQKPPLGDQRVVREPIALRPADRLVGPPGRV